MITNITSVDVVSARNDSLVCRLPARVFFVRCRIPSFTTSLLVTLFIASGFLPRLFLPVLTLSRDFLLRRLISSARILPLCLGVGHLVPYEVVEGENGANERGEVHQQKLVVCLHGKRGGNLLQMEIREEVEDVLELVEDRVVHGQLSGHHLLEVVSDVLEVFEETLEGVKLAADSLAQCPNRLVLDVPAHRTYTVVQFT